MTSSIIMELSPGCKHKNVGENKLQTIRKWIFQYYLWASYLRSLRVFPVKSQTSIKSSTEPVTRYCPVLCEFCIFDVRLLSKFDACSQLSSWLFLFFDDSFTSRKIDTGIGRQQSLLLLFQRLSEESKKMRWRYHWHLSTQSLSNTASFHFSLLDIRIYLSCFKIRPSQEVLCETRTGKTL